MYSAQYVVGSLHVQIQGPFQVQVQCILFTVQCAGCSVMPAKDEDWAVETRWIKWKIILKNKFSKTKKHSVFYKDGLRLYISENLEVKTKS